MADPDADLANIRELYRHPDSDAITALQAHGIADDVLAAAHGLEVAARKIRAALLGELDDRPPRPTGWIDYLDEKSEHAHYCATRLADLLEETRRD